MRKKLFAILMSAMMMVTFMPTMAFATTVTATASYGGDRYGKMIAKCSTGTEISIDTTREMNEYGIVEASITDTQIDAWFTLNGGFYTADEVDAAKTAMKAANGENDGDKLVKKCFYDFTDAKLVAGNSGQTATALPNAIQKASVVAPDFVEETDGTWTYNGNAKIQFTVQSYDKNYVPATPEYVFVDADSFAINGGWDMTVSLSGYDKTSAASQPCSLVVKMLTTKDTQLAEKFKDSGVSHAITVGAGAAETIANEEFYVDGDKNKVVTPVKDNDMTGFESAYVKYDGAEHKLVAKEIAGVTVSYYKFNASTGAWDAVDAIAWKDYTASAANYKVVLSDGVVANTVETFLDVAVTKANVTVDFVDGNVYEDESLDAYDYLKVVGLDDTAKLAVKADAEALKNVLKQRYKATSTVDAHDATKVALEAKDVYSTLTKAEQKALDEAMVNYNVKKEVRSFFSSYYEAGYPAALTGTLTVIEGKLANEIEFVSAPKVKTYHNKKGKLAKTHTFTVKAEALSGIAPSYKLINANSKIVINKTTGKITVKKGLKKGTYTVKVKAYGAAGNGYKAASETQTIKVKVVK